ncbi:MAG TPA: HNH endonuclease signature motif containing protein [Kofleriaceae bacterium]|nr:HNH endonuclease signature motif containing protein [Kofleriaceae bacterium]
MSTEIAGELRRLVTERAGARCEYCLLPEALALHRHEPDHIVPRQHGGDTSAENLALACMRCNRHKGPNVGSFDPATGVLVRFFHPRLDRWTEHFRFDGVRIEALTAEGRVTVKILRLHDEDRLVERALMTR